MRGGLSRWLARGVVLLAAGSTACRAVVPERYAVNAPLGNLLFGWTVGAPDTALFGSRIQVPPDFAIGLYAEVPQARFLRATPSSWRCPRRPCRSSP